MHFGSTLRLLRLESGLGLRDLARRLGVSSAYLSRVENGLDPAPTAARLAHIARELSVPETVLVDLGERVHPFLADYVADVPEAGALFLDVARRRLGAEELAELRAFIDARFPAVAATGAPVLGVSDLLAPDRVIVGLRCTSMDDLIDVVSGRLASGSKTGATGAGVAAVAAALKKREMEASGAIGDGLVVASASLPGVPERAALATLARPFAYATPDGAPLFLAVFLVGPPATTSRASRLAQLARLAGRGLARDLHGRTSPSHVVSRLALLEKTW